MKVTKVHKPKHVLRKSVALSGSKFGRCVLNYVLRTTHTLFLSPFKPDASQQLPPRRQSNSLIDQQADSLTLATNTATATAGRNETWPRLLVTRLGRVRLQRLRIRDKFRYARKWRKRCYVCPPPRLASILRTAQANQPRAP